MKQKSFVFLFAIVCCLSGGLQAQNCDESVGASFKVSYTTAKPNVMDFFTAYAQWRKETKAYDESDGIIVGAYSCVVLKKPIPFVDENGQSQLLAHMKADVASGYIAYDNGEPESLGLECCYWNTADRTKVIFAVNYIDNNPGYTNRMMIMTLLLRSQRR